MKRLQLPDYLIPSLDWNVAGLLRLCENVYSVKLPCSSNIAIMSAALIPYTLSQFFLADVWKQNKRLIGDFTPHGEREADSLGEITVQFSF